MSSSSRRVRVKRGVSSANNNSVDYSSIGSESTNKKERIDKNPYLNSFDDHFSSPKNN